MLGFHGKIALKDSNYNLQRATVTFGPETGYEVVPLEIHLILCVFVCILNIIKYSEQFREMFCESCVGI